jgi:hypothetical protein
MKPHAAAVKIAKECWRSVSRSEHACVQWLKDNERKFRVELDPILRLFSEVGAKRLERPNLSPREREREQELLEQRLQRDQREARRDQRDARERALKWERDHPKERAEKRRRADEAREQKIERWHEWFRDDPKAALAHMLNEIQRDEKSFDDD